MKRELVVTLLLLASVWSTLTVLPSGSVYGSGSAPSDEPLAVTILNQTITLTNTTFVTETSTLHATVTGSPVTTQVTTTQTSTQGTTSTSTSLTITSNTITVPSLVYSTAIVSATKTNVLTTTTTQTTNALALVWQGKDYSVLFWIGVFAALCIAAVVVFSLSGRAERKSSRKPAEWEKQNGV